MGQYFSDPPQRPKPTTLETIGQLLSMGEGFYGLYEQNQRAQDADKQQAFENARQTATDVRAQSTADDQHSEFLTKQDEAGYTQSETPGAIRNPAAPAPNPDLSMTVGNVLTGSSITTPNLSHHVGGQEDLTVQDAPTKGAWSKTKESTAELAADKTNDFKTQMQQQKDTDTATRAHDQAIAAQLLQDEKNSGAMDRAELNMWRHGGGNPNAKTPEERAQDGAQKQLDADRGRMDRVLKTAPNPDDKKFQDPSTGDADQPAFERARQNYVADSSAVARNIHQDNARLDQSFGRTPTQDDLQGSQPPADPSVVREQAANAIARTRASGRPQSEIDAAVAQINSRLRKLLGGYK